MVNFEFSVITSVVAGVNVRPGVVYAAFSVMNCVGAWSMLSLAWSKFGFLQSSVSVCGHCGDFCGQVCR